MKNTIYLFLSCIILTGCTDLVLDGPPIVSKVEINTDSLHSYPGKYKIYLKSDHGSDPVFYSYDRYNSGEILVPMSNLQAMMDRKTKSYLDTIASMQRQIDRMKSEKETMEQQMNEKEMLIRFLTGK